MNAETPPKLREEALRPPHGFLLALLAQGPAIAGNWPLQPSVIEVAGGTALLVWGLLWNIWAEKLFRRAATGICPFSPATTLVKGGPFRISRNPMYVGMVAMSAGIALTTGILSNAWISVALAIWLNYAFILPEEAFLRRGFGAEYDDFAQRVPRWLLTK